jgi:hypothetical protein
MLHTIPLSRAAKTFGIGVTYRSGGEGQYSTCPNSCELKPAEATGADEIDRDYEAAVREAVPAFGLAFLFTHFHPRSWAVQNLDKMTVFNWSAPCIEKAVFMTAAGTASVAVVPKDFWKHTASPRSVTVNGVKCVRCPQEYDERINCGNCGDGEPFCARWLRKFAVIFTSHGPGAKLAGDPNKRGGCYAGFGKCQLWWKRLADRARRIGSHGRIDAVEVKSFARSLPRGTILRHHIAGDLGVDVSGPGRLAYILHQEPTQ